MDEIRCVICEASNEYNGPAELRCTGCDKCICRDCWSHLDGPDTWKNCDSCPGYIYK